jgi:hypothetical protein
MYKHRPHRLQPPRSSSYSPDRLPLWLSCPLLPTRPPPATYQMSWPWASWGPASWIVSTGEAVCADWANGETTAATDPLLQAGGLYVYHDAIFDAITNEDVCPFVNSH